MRLCLQRGKPNEDDYLGIVEHAVSEKVQICDAINNISYIENMEEMAGSCSPEVVCVMWYRPDGKEMR